MKYALLIYNTPELRELPEEQLKARRLLDAGPWSARVAAATAENDARS
jgi:hypothetical protein